MNHLFCMADREVFFYERNEDGSIHTGIDGKPVFSVIRPVDTERLEELRTDPESVLDLWQLAVAEGNERRSLEQYFEYLMETECDDLEGFPHKDSSFVNYLSDEDRAMIDKDCLDTHDIQVGTWEASGCFRPDVEAITAIYADKDSATEILRLLGANPQEVYARLP